MDDSDALHAGLRQHLAAAPADGGWDALVAAGAVGLGVPEDLGGLIWGSGAAASVMSAIGAHALATPYLETAIIAPRLLSGQRTPAGDAVLREIATGATIAVAGLDPRLRAGVSATPTMDGWRLDGDAPLVLDGGSAGHILVAARTEGYSSALLSVKAGQDGLLSRRYPTIDGRDAADLRFIAVDATLLAQDVDEMLTGAGDAALAYLAIEAAALMQRLVDDTIAYTRQRTQFGQPIASFQVVQHRLVDMHIHARRAKAIAWRAVGALDGHWAERARLVSAAKVTVADAGRFVGQNAVQLHGGMGMTQDLPVARCFKRLAMIEHELGSADQHRQRFARIREQQQAA